MYECLCLLVLWIDSTIKMGKNCYLQVFLQECKYVVKESKITKKMR